MLPGHRDSPCNPYCLSLWRSQESASPTYSLLAKGQVTAANRPPLPALLDVYPRPSRAGCRLRSRARALIRLSASVPGRCSRVPRLPRAAPASPAGAQLLAQAPKTLAVHGGLKRGAIEHLQPGFPVRYLLLKRLFLTGKGRYGHSRLG
jgi:hypothetical protein